MTDQTLDAQYHDLYKYAMEQKHKVATLQAKKADKEAADSITETRDRLAAEADARNAAIEAAQNALPARGRKLHPFSAGSHATPKKSRAAVEAAQDAQDAVNKGALTKKLEREYMTALKARMKEERLGRFGVRGGGGDK